MNFASISTGWILLKKGLKSMAIGAVLLTAAAASAQAHDGYDRGGWHEDYGRHRGEWQRHHAPHYYWYGDRYIAPRVIYAPPVVYAPPPVYREPGFTLVLPLNIR